MTAFELYLLLKLDDIRSLLFGAWIFGLLAPLPGLIAAGMLHDVGSEEGASLVLGAIKRWAIRIVAVGFAAITVRVFVPTTKEMAAIYIVPRVVNNEQVQAIGQNGLKILEAYTKELLEDIAPIKAEEKKQ